MKLEDTKKKAHFYIRAMSRPKEKSVKQSLYNATENKMLTNMCHGAAKVPRTHARKMIVCSFKSAGAEKDEPDSYLTIQHKNELQMA